MARPKKRLGLLFGSNPPRDEKLICDLFWNRQRELRVALEMLKDGDDFPEICAVYGNTRSGKSHLVRRLLVDVRKKRMKYLVVEVNANNRGTAQAALRSGYAIDPLFVEVLREAP